MKCTATVTVDAPSISEASQVLAERLGHDEDLGFDYTLRYSEPRELNVANAVEDVINAHDTLHGQVEQRARAAAAMEAAIDAAGSPVVSHAGGTHWHLVLRSKQEERDIIDNRPWCRRTTRQSHLRRKGAGAGNHDLWREASVRNLADMPPCQRCAAAGERVVTESIFDLT